MKRRGIFAWLLGAVTLFGHREHDMETAPEMEMACRDIPNLRHPELGISQVCESTGRIIYKESFAKDRCPVCGTKAQPFVTGYVSSGEAFNLARCKRCNAAFWQDAK